MKRTILSLLLALSLVACGDTATTLVVDDVASPPDLGSSAYDQKRARLPWPAEDKGFVFEGHLRAMGTALGPVRLTAVPRADKPGWKTTMHAEIEMAGVQLDSSAVFDQYLTPISGSYAEKKQDGDSEKSWVATKAGLEVTTAGSKEPEVLEHEGAFVTGVMELFLFCRLTDFSDESFEVAICDLDDMKLTAGTWTCGKRGEWEGTPAVLLTGKRADNKTLAAAFDPDTGELLGIKMGEAGKIFEFHKGPAPVQEKGFFERDAKTAQEAAAQAALSFATADIDLLERITHWPSVYEKITAANPSAAVGEELLKSAILKDLRGRLEAKGTKEMLGPLLQSMATSLEATGTDDESVVDFGPAFANLKLTVGKRDGKWMLVAMPKE